MRDNSHGCFSHLKRFLKSYQLGRSALLMGFMTPEERDAVLLLIDFKNRVSWSDNYPFEKDSDDAEGGI